MRSKFYLAILILAIFAGCQSIETKKIGDIELSQKLIGKWEIAKSGHFGTCTFQSNGYAQGFHRFPPDELNPNGEKVSEFTFRHRWKIEEGFLISYDIETDPPGIIGSEVTTVDQILSINEKEFVYKTSRGDIFVMRRID